MASSPPEYGDFSLASVARILENFQPPSGTFDPSGNWQQRYRAFVDIGRRPVEVGWVQLQRTPLGPDTFRLAVRREHRLADGRQLVYGSVICRADELATPLEWEWESTALEADGTPVKGLSVHKRGTFAEGAVSIATAQRTRRYECPGRCALNWALFEAVQRLPRAAGGAWDFTLVDHFDELKQQHVLAFRRSLPIALGKPRVEEEAVSLERGTVFRPRRVFDMAKAENWHGFDQTGRGIVPIVYWVSDSGRLLLVMAGLELYLLDPNSGAES